MANMNFGIAVRLIEQGVQAGANRIKASLRSIQFQALAMAGAMAGGVTSLQSLISTLVDTARQASRVQTALRNISTDMGQYAKSIDYLRKLSEEYGLDLIGTTEAFTKFSAAATASGMAMAEQEKVFTALSRSITAFGLGGNEATMTFYAVSQMMAKGKISAEELRRQLGERMPIAMEAMSRAARSMGFKENLDDLLKQGKLISREILPKFAEELNKLVVDVDTDNVETSINRLKNQLAGLAEAWDISGKFKAIVDYVRSGLEHLRKSTATLAGVIGGLLGAKLWGGIYKSFAGHIVAMRRLMQSEGVQVEGAMARIRLAGGAMGQMFKTVGVAIRGMLASFAPMLLIGGIISIITKINEMGEAWGQSAKAMQDYQAGLATAGDRDLSSLERALRVLEDKASTEQDILLAKDKLQGYLGQEINDSNELVRIARQRLAYERQIARAKYADQQGIEAEMKLKALNAERVAKYGKGGEITAEQIAEFKRQGIDKQGAFARFGVLVESLLSLDGKDTNARKNKARFAELYPSQRQRFGASAREKYDRDVLSAQRGDGESISDFYEDLAKASSLQAVIKQSEEHYKDYIKGIKTEDLVPKTPTASPTQSEATTDKAKTQKRSPLEQAEEDYKQGLKELNNQHHLGLISEQEYRSKLSELKERIHKRIGGLLGDKATSNATYRATSDYERKQEESNASKAIKAYSDSLGEEIRKHREGITTEEEYTRAVRSLTERTLERLGGEAELTEAERQYMQGLKGLLSRGGALAGEAPQRAVRDTSLDYKKSESDKLREEKDIVDRHIAELERAKTALNDYSEELRVAQAESRKLSEALKIAEIRTDLKRLSEEVDKGLVGSFREVGQAIRSVSTSIRGMYATLKDDNADGLEKLLATFEGIIGAVDAISGVVAFFDRLRESKAQLAVVERAYYAQSQAGSTAQIASKQAEMAVQTQAVAQEATNLATAQAAILTDASVRRSVALANVASAQGEATANAARGASVLPFPANLLAMAGAVSSALAIFRGLPKFANGGIVPGNSRSGDRVLAGVNSGELILNEAQQHNIASKLLRRDNTAVEVHISERLRGSDLRRSVKTATRRADR